MMKSWESIQSALGYIEGHLTEDLPVAEIAGSASLSPFYFQRLFGRLVGCPVGEYVRLRRLAAASEDISHSLESIFDIGFKYNFSDSANFTRAFREAYGLSPAELRACPQTLKHFSKPDLNLTHQAFFENDIMVSDGMAIRIERVPLAEDRHFHGLTGNIPENQLIGSSNTGVAFAGHLWEEFHRRKPTLTGLVEPGVEIGVLMRAGTVPGYAAYLAGAEVIAGSRNPEFESIVLRAGEYVVCAFDAPGFSELTGAALEKAYGILMRWVQEKSISIHQMCYEIYPSTCLEDPAMQLWLPLAREAKPSMTAADIAPVTLADLSAGVGNPLWDELSLYLIEEYQAKPVLEYSRCSFKPGWNVKYKKSGRTLCTLYPGEGCFTVLLVIGEAERLPFEMELPLMARAVQRLYSETKLGMGQRWLMVDVSSAEILADLKFGIGIRHLTHTKKGGKRNAANI